MRKALILTVFLLTIASFADVLVTFKDGSVLKCDRVVRKSDQILVVEKDGKKMLIHKNLIKSVKEADQGNPPVPAVTGKNQMPPREKTEATKPGSLVLTDDNVERTVPYKPYALIEQEKKKAPRAEPPISINVVSQKTTRSGDTVTFEGTVKNDMTETVHKLKMVVQALDAKGKVFAETASQIASSIEVGKTAIFSFQFKDPSTTISRFSFRFEGVSGGSEAK